MERTTAEISEIERHKYFLSEKQGYDVGWEFAEQDWEQSYGDQFRARCGGGDTAAIETCPESVESTGNEGCAAVGEVATRVDDAPAASTCPSNVPAPRWRQFLSKLWSR